MCANDCLTEVERRPSAEHAGCGATVPRSDADSNAGGRTQCGRSLWCAGTDHSHQCKARTLRWFSTCPYLYLHSRQHGGVTERPLLSETAAGAGGAVCNSDCDGTVWLRVATLATLASEGTADRGSFQKKCAAANGSAGARARGPPEASAPAAFALEQRCSSADEHPGHCGHCGQHAIAAHRALTSRLSAFAQASPTALNTLHRVGPWLVLTCEPACPGRASRAKTASALSS